MPGRFNFQYYGLYCQSFSYDSSSLFCSCVEHRTFMKLFHVFLPKASPFTSLQLYPDFCSSLSVVLLLVVLGLPLSLPYALRVPVQCVSFSCTLQFTWCMTNCLLFHRCAFCAIIHHSKCNSAAVVWYSECVLNTRLMFRIRRVNTRLMFRIRREHPSTKPWWLSYPFIFHVLYSYKRTDLTFVLNNTVLVLVNISYLYSLRNK
jgi:hypothetical protein